MRERRFHVGQSDRGALARRPAEVIDLLVMQNREQPRPQVRAGLPQMDFLDPPGEGFLDEIL
jgi:hypothetical protein